MHLISAILFTSVLLSIFQYNEAYTIGLGRADCTGPPVQINFLGYVNLQQVGTGIHLRQFSRAFIIYDGVTRIVFVSVDIAMFGDVLKKRVLDKLGVLYGTLYSQENVIISAIHTHGTPGGYMLYTLYDISIYGFVQESLDAYAEGIFKSIVRAHDSMVDGQVFFRKGSVQNANINRSPSAYLNNPPSELSRYTTNVNKILTQLQFVRRSDGITLGVFNWFAVHPVSMNMSNTLVTSDNMGYASILLEKQLNPNDLPGQGQFVGAFASSNLGDSSPNTKGPKCIDTGEDCDGQFGSCNNDNTKCIAFGPGVDMEDSTRIIAETIEGAASVLLTTAGMEVTGSVKIAHQFVKMADQTVEYQLKNGTKVTGKGCVPALGLSLAGGTTDGPNFGLQALTTTPNTGIPFLDLILSAMQLLINILLEDTACHAPKPILLPTGRISVPYEWQPSIVPTHIATIGPIVLAAVPGELTTMSGRRLQEKLEETMKTNPDIVPENVNVIITGLSNCYSSYITTPEEYQIQRYEGASTIYGPYTLPIYMEQFDKLLEACIAGTPVPPGNPPNFNPPRLTAVGAAVADGLFNKTLNCVQQPASSAARGSTVTAVFEAGNPRNNLRQGDTFLKIQISLSDSWQTVANDACWETKFEWAKAPLSTQSYATVKWTIPSNAALGIYRIVHIGNYNPLLDSSYEYTVYSNTFNVVA